jgi:carbon monoxide dehydrogenase subunit G
VLIESEFVVPAPMDVAWNHLLDVERGAPCAPGAELTEVVDDRTWKGRIKVKLGPIALSSPGPSRWPNGTTRTIGWSFAHRGRRRLGRELRPPP